MSQALRAGFRDSTAPLFRAPWRLQGWGRQLRGPVGKRLAVGRCAGTPYLRLSSARTFGASQRASDKAAGRRSSRGYSQASRPPLPSSFVRVGKIRAARVGMPARARTPRWLAARIAAPSSARCCSGRVQPSSGRAHF